MADVVRANLGIAPFPAPEPACDRDCMFRHPEKGHDLNCAAHCTCGALAFKGSYLGHAPDCPARK